MKDSQEQIKVMELLAKNEEMAGKLYELFKMKLPAHGKFWNSLAKEELVHASWIRKIYPEVKTGRLTFNKDRFSPRLIQNSINYLERKISQSRKRKISFQKALEAALEVEITFPESNFFKVYDTDSRKLKQLLNALKDAFGEHRDKLLDMLHENRRQRTA
ncbi:MAG: hypothetical protein PHP17_00605 [Candidatus Omnitrophica bacterium]|nr:hypothetical protein [Candidatus Omnitrophota bacterium]